MGERRRGSSVREIGVRHPSAMLIVGLLAAVIAGVVAAAPLATGSPSVHVFMPTSGLSIGVQDLDGRGLSLGDRLAVRGLPP